jgi:hypothetical protein
MFYGGLIAAAFVLVGYAASSAAPVQITDLVLAPSRSTRLRPHRLFHARLLHGKITHSCLGVSFPRGSPPGGSSLGDASLLPQTRPMSLPVLPTQLFESAANAFLFVVLYWLYRRHQRKTGLVTDVTDRLRAAALRHRKLARRPRLAVGPFPSARPSASPFVFDAAASPTRSVEPGARPRFSDGPFRRQSAGTAEACGISSFSPAGMAILIPHPHS